MDRFPDSDFELVVLWSDASDSSVQLRVGAVVEFGFVGGDDYDVTFPEALYSALFEDANGSRTLRFRRTDPRKMVYEGNVRLGAFYCSVSLIGAFANSFAASHYSLSGGGDNQSGGWGGGW